MWFAMRAVDASFVETAPKTYTVECLVRRPRKEVFAAYADPASWISWFPGVREANYGDSPLPFGVGTRRYAQVGGFRYDEVIVAWDEDRRFGYYLERATLPIAHAQLELTEFEDAPEGTLVRWTIAADPRPMLRLVSPVFRSVLALLFGRAMRRLEGYLSAA